jgi:hypothetical protein
VSGRTLSVAVLKVVKDWLKKVENCEHAPAEKRSCRFM